MKDLKPYILIVVVALLIGTIYFINSSSVKRGGTSDTEVITPRKSAVQDEVTTEDKMKRYELAKEITTPDGFINTDGNPITIGELIGKKVILIDFWTYSCINCQRTTPYLNAWYEKYLDKGLVIIGMHTPEFEFEKNYDNVNAAVEKFDIKFPVVLDNDYSTWTAYKNRYWPRKYLIDIDGYIVYDHIGEGAYEETEKKIQHALNERMAVLGEEVTIDQTVTKEIPIQGGPRSPETYFGSSREPREKNFLQPSGAWDISPEFAQNTAPDATITYTYTAKDVFFVAQSDTPVAVEVLLDGKPVGSKAGADIITAPDGKSIVNIKEARLYKIIQDTNSETHTLELKIQQPGLQAFTFTFG